MYFYFFQIWLKFKNFHFFSFSVFLKGNHLWSTILNGKNLFNYYNITVQLKYHSAQSKYNLIPLKYHSVFLVIKEVIVIISGILRSSPLFCHCQLHQHFDRSTIRHNWSTFRLHWSIIQYSLFGERLQSVSVEYSVRWSFSYFTAPLSLSVSKHRLYLLLRRKVPVSVYCILDRERSSLLWHSAFDLAVYSLLRLR